LLVIERETGINDFLEVGTELDAKLSADLLGAIFHPQSPIHDGAIIIQRGRLTRAGCFLPLTQNPSVSPRLGSRHRAAIGLTELVDAVAIVVSEETGKVSVVVSGKMTRDLDSITLRKVLRRLLEPRRPTAGKR
jgi:DNA integrity scanning protein DisA with diadenylate cyclase activity